VLNDNSAVRTLCIRVIAYDGTPRLTILISKSRCQDLKISA